MIKNGLGIGLDFYKNDELNKKLLTYLAKVNTSLGNEMFEERKIAEKMFDDAVKKV